MDRLSIDFQRIAIVMVWLIIIALTVYLAIVGWADYQLFGLVLSVAVGIKCLALGLSIVDWILEK